MFEGLDFGAILTAGGLAKLGQIIVGDLSMAGDNVVIMGALASGLPARDRQKVLLFGASMALIFLIIFALIATRLLRITGLVFAGGLLLLWVAYNMWRDLHPKKIVVADDPTTAVIEGPPPSKTLLQAAVAITIADLSMSIDNVLLVASIARENPALLVVGLSFSVLFMGISANYVARLVERFPWLNYIGLAVILWVGSNMILEGWVGGEHVLGLRHVLRLG